MKLLGKQFADTLLETIRTKVAELSHAPAFTDIVVGDDKASLSYVEMKKKKALSVGIKWIDSYFPIDAITEDVISRIETFNADPDMKGLIIQLPLPSHIDTKRVLDAVAPRLDVDCTGTICKEKFYSGHPEYMFPTARAIFHLLDESDLDMVNKNIVIVGEGELVGRPVAQIFKSRGVHTISINSRTPEKERLIKDADILICAAGSPGMITGDMIKPGAFVIDAGTSESNGSVVGDVDTPSVEKVAGMLVPSPGGVGPLTVAYLLDNVVRSATMTQ